ncbi:MAG: hypothetical protein RSG07_05645 [Erysipelotrichaceae bacterium]
MNIDYTYQMSLDQFISVDNKQTNKLNDRYEQALNKLKECTLVRSKLKKQTIALESLKIHDSCLEAYLVLGSCANDPHIALNYFKKGVDKATITLGKNYFFKDNKDFYCEETKLYFKLKTIYAKTLYEVGYMKQALVQFTNIYTYNPNDNENIIYYLISTLLYFEKYDKVLILLEKHDNAYLRCLYYYKQGYLDQASYYLQIAKKEDVGIVEQLMGSKRNIEITNDLVMVMLKHIAVLSYFREWLSLN